MICKQTIPIIDVESYYQIVKSNQQLYYLLTQQTYITLSLIGSYHEMFTCLANYDKALKMYHNLICHLIETFVCMIHLFQTLCILANIADGNSAKDFIMSNEDILKKITYYMVRR